MASPATRFDFRSYQPVVHKVAEAYKKAERIKVTAPSGTDIEASIKGRRINVDNGLCHEPGKAIGIPIMEVNAAPIEHTTNGKIVIDTSMSFLGILREKITLTVKDGYIQKIEGGEEAQKMKDILESKNDPNVYVIAEIAIGLNPKAEIKGILAEDEGVLGTMHFGIGNNITLGGMNKASLHMDVIINRPTMLLDEVLLTKDGKLQV
jgi:leucyl aminopeptidase (aminopeptidase T)